MNQKAYSILFCALFASTFAHEFRAKAAAYPSFATKVLERESHANSSSVSDICHIKCYNEFSSNTTLEGNGSITVTANASAGLFVAVNVNAAVIIDVHASFVVVFNGTTGAAVAINLKNSTGVYIPKGGWLASETSFQSYVVTFNVTALYKLPGAETFEISTASTTIIKVVNGVVVRLVSTTIAAEIQVNDKQGLQLLVAIANLFIELENGSMKGVLELIASKEIHLIYGLTEFLNLLVGLGRIFGKIAGGVLKISINLAELAAATHGVQVLLIVMLELHAAKINIGAVMGTMLNDAEELFNLLVQLGGNVDHGPSGLFKVVTRIIELINGKVDVELVIMALMNFVAKPNQALFTEFQATLSLFLKVVIKVGGESLKKLETILKALIAENFEMNNVNISEIINLLSGKEHKKGNLLKVIVAVILKLKAIVSASKSLPMLMFVLILQLNSPTGIKLIKGIIEIEIKIVAIEGSFILAVGKSIRNIASLLREKIYYAFEKMPVISSICERVNEAISACSNGEISLKHILNESTSFKNLIEALFQWKAGISLGVSTTNMTNMKNIVNNCTHYSSAFSFNSTVTGESS